MRQWERDMPEKYRPDHEKGYETSVWVNPSHSNNHLGFVGRRRTADKRHVAIQHLDFPYGRLDVKSFDAKRCVMHYGTAVEALGAEHPISLTLGKSNWKLVLAIAVPSVALVLSMAMVVAVMMLFRRRLHVKKQQQQVEEKPACELSVAQDGSHHLCDTLVAEGVADDDDGRHGDAPPPESIAPPPEGMPHPSDGESEELLL